MSIIETIAEPANAGKEFKSHIVFENREYNSSVFFTPIVKGTSEYKKIVTKMSSRKQIDKQTGALVTCLEITPSVIKEFLDDVNTSLYLFVNEKGKTSSDQASGSLQVANWNIDPAMPSQPWICDLCRHAPDPTKKSAVSPVKLTILLFEQLAYYVFGKSEIFLMVDNSEKSVLIPLYEKYGFAVDNSFILANGDIIHSVMKKTIVPIPHLMHFPFRDAVQSSTLTTSVQDNPSKKSDTIEGGKNKKTGHK